ncbi:hypothetical protein EMEDMD4_490113 [Sinorhizobium medicae]|uniref:Uncharacterized protein n=1 Tax=Sinorhizobium medicae TaxID=110321 RepID=A0A508X0P0_9HYPH|nr:hypothetical protein EMEDMD4_490113 [Sinorhizobium medicae]
MLPAASQSRYWLNCSLLDAGIVTRLTLWPVCFSNLAICSRRKLRFLPVELAAIDNSPAAATSIAPTIAAQEISVLIKGFTSIGPSKTPSGFACSSKKSKTVWVRRSCQNPNRLSRYGYIGSNRDSHLELFYLHSGGYTKNRAIDRQPFSLGGATWIKNHPQEFKTIWFMMPAIPIAPARSAEPMHGLWPSANPV